MLRLLLGVAALIGWSVPASAAEPTPWAMGFQAAASPIAQQQHGFHDILLFIIFAIAIFVLALLLYVIYRFRESKNVEPSKTTHNTLIEVVWTVIPIIILIVIAIPSFKLLYAEDKSQDAEMTIKATGYQWYWGYEYQDHDGLTFDSYMIPDDEIKEGQIRLLSVDNALVVPVDTKIRVLVTAGDVLHSFALPAFGVKIDAVPGKLNETWFLAEAVGTYYGQCSEICGTGHSFMPIEIEVVSKDDFEAWLKKAKEEFAGLTAPAPAVARSSPEAPRSVQVAEAVGAR